MLSWAKDVFVILMLFRVIDFQLIISVVAIPDGDVDCNVGHVNLRNYAALTLRVINPHIEHVLRIAIKFCPR